MPTLHVRNVPEELYQRLKRRAAERQRSLSAEVVLLLEHAAARTPEEEETLFDRIRRRRAHIAEAVGPFPSSVELLRDDRSR